MKVNFSTKVKYIKVKGKDLKIGDRAAKYPLCGCVFKVVKDASDKFKCLELQLWCKSCKIRKTVLGIGIDAAQEFIILKG